MGSENDLIQKLMISKKIMEKHNAMPRNHSGSDVINLPSAPELKTFDAPQANYNIPQELMMESKPVSQTPKVATKDKILSSKLPDEIKKLMIEHPIVPQNNMQGAGLSNELVEKASRLMNVNAAGQQTRQHKIQETSYVQPQNQVSGLDADLIKQIIRETVEEVLSENGLLIESASKSNDVFSFKVGKHIFEGKVTRIKKIKE